MRNNKGQALIEFVLIIPLFIFLLFSVYDIGMIFYKKNSLENSSSDIIELYTSGKELNEIEMMYDNLKINVIDDSEYKKIIISDNVKLITPGLNRVFGDPYKISVERYIVNE